MRIVWRLAMLGIVVMTAGVVGLVVTSWSDRVHSGPSDVSGLTWTHLGPKLAAAIGEAETAAEEHARAKIDAWLEQVLARTEGPFLDWHFSYFSGRLRDIEWTFKRIWSGRTEADQAYLAEIESKFSELVLSPDQATAELAKIAEAASEAFEARLGVNLSTLRRELSMDEASFAALLRSITISVFDSSGARHRVNLLAIAKGSRQLMGIVRWAGERLQRRPPQSVKYASALLGVGAGQAAIPATGMGTKVVTAKVAAAGAAIAAVVVIAVAVGYEWYSHTEYVREYRPRVKEDVRAAIRQFADHALSAEGRVGIGLHSAKTAIVEAIRLQESPWGRMKARLQFL